MPDLQHDAGQVFEVINASARGGETGLVLSRPPPAGWSTSTSSSTSSLACGSVFTPDMPITGGQAWDLTVGLPAWSYGTADTRFLHTAQLAGVELFDAQDKAIGDCSLLSASGTDHARAVPEPAAAVLMLAGLCPSACFACAG